MRDRTPDLYERTQLLLDNWKRDILKLEVEVRHRLGSDEPCEWLIGLSDSTKVKHAELESVLRGNCPPSKGETQMLPEDEAEGGKPAKGKPPPPYPGPFHLQ